MNAEIYLAVYMAAVLAIVCMPALVAIVALIKKPEKKDV